MPPLEMQCVHIHGRFSISDDQPRSSNEVLADHLLAENVPETSVCHPVGGYYDPATG
jgi:hypothetical protein